MLDEITTCLNCKRPRCTNCLGDNHHSTKFQSIVQIDRITEKVIARFSSAAEASRKTGINQRSISAAAAGKYKSAGGYIWRIRRGDTSCTT